MQRIYKVCTDLNNGSKVEFGFIPDKVHCFNLDNLAEFISYPSSVEDIDNAQTIEVNPDGVKTGALGVILPFEGEFIAPENEGEANVRLSKGIIFKSGLSTDADLLIIAEMND